MTHDSYYAGSGEHRAAADARPLVGADWAAARPGPGRTFDPWPARFFGSPSAGSGDYHAPSATPTHFWIDSPPNGRWPAPLPPTADPRGREHASWSGAVARIGAASSNPAHGLAPGPAFPAFDPTGAHSYVPASYSTTSKPVTAFPRLDEHARALHAPAGEFSYAAPPTPQQWPQPAWPGPVAPPIPAPLSTATGSFYSTGTPHTTPPWHALDPSTRDGWSASPLAPATLVRPHLVSPASAPAPDTPTTVSTALAPESRATPPLAVAVAAPSVSPFPVQSAPRPRPVDPPKARATPKPPRPPVDPAAAARAAVLAPALFRHGGASGAPSTSSSARLAPAPATATVGAAPWLASPSASSSTTSTATSSTSSPSSSSPAPPSACFLGAYTAEERIERVQRYLEKRGRRIWGVDQVRYKYRSMVARSRVRIPGGRFGDRPIDPTTFISQIREHAPELLRHARTGLAERCKREREEPAHTSPPGSVSESSAETTDDASATRSVRRCSSSDSEGSDEKAALVPEVEA